MEYFVFVCISKGFIFFLVLSLDMIFFSRRNVHFFYLLPHCRMLPHYPYLLKACILLSISFINTKYMYNWRIPVKCHFGMSLKSNSKMQKKIPLSTLKRKKNTKFNILKLLFFRVCVFFSLVFEVISMSFLHSMLYLVSFVSVFGRFFVWNGILPYRYV